jgi:molybdopterin-containing oxidoreductase family membrane subunit
LFFGRFAFLFLPTVAGLIISFVFLAIQALRSSGFSLKGTVIVSLIILIALWVKRYLFLVTSLFYPRLPYPPGSYTPTWTEWSLIAGTFAISFLAYLLFVKIYPIMELKGR